MESESVYQIQIGCWDIKDPSSFRFEVKKFLWEQRLNQTKLFNTILTSIEARTPVSYRVEVDQSCQGHLGPEDGW